MNILKSAIVLCIVSVLLAGCGMCPFSKGPRNCGTQKQCSAKMAEGKHAQLCAKCGEVAGSEKCCKPAEKCEKCGLHKGSPGCCKHAKK